MRALALCGVVLASCVVPEAPSEPDIASETSAVIGRGGLSLPETTRSVAWEPNGDCGRDDRGNRLACDGEFLWPSGAGITSAFTLIRKGPNLADGSPTFLAFVVWNHGVVGRILRAEAGAKGRDLLAKLDGISIARTRGAPDHSTGSAGNLSGGKVPPAPQPNVNDPLEFSEKYLNAAKTAALQIERASLEFNGYSE